MDSDQAEATEARLEENRDWHDVGFDLGSGNHVSPRALPRSDDMESRVKARMYWWNGEIEEDALAN